MVSYRKLLKMIRIQISCQGSGAGSSRDTAPVGDVHGQLLDERHTDVTENDDDGHTLIS